MGFCARVYHGRLAVISIAYIFQDTFMFLHVFFSKHNGIHISLWTRQVKPSMFRIFFYAA